MRPVANLHTAARVEARFRHHAMHQSGYLASGSCIARHVNPLRTTQRKLAHQLPTFATPESQSASQ
jgi:hypothetical protein